MKDINRKIILFTTLLVMLPLFFHGAFADVTDLDKIKEPVTKVYDMIKYLVSAIALIIITVAGIKFMTSSDNIQAREGTKTMISYAVLGLLVIWVAPFVVNYLTAPAV